MNISNQSVIDEWSNYTEDDLQQFGDEGDDARRNLIDPVILQLAGNLQNKKVLDAGCGNGYLSRKLAKLGAKVDGVEPSSSLYQYCSKLEKENPQGITYKKEDLTKLDISDAYDTVLLINVLMDIPDYKSALRNCIKALKANGQLILSILHPCFPGFENDWKKLNFVKIENYFDPVPIKQKYGYLIQRPLQDYINTLIKLGCSIERVVEPRLKSSTPDSSSRNALIPQFLIIKVTKK